MKKLLYKAESLVLLCVLLLCGCGGTEQMVPRGTGDSRPGASSVAQSSAGTSAKEQGNEAQEPAKQGTRDFASVVLVNQADGSESYENEYAVIDASHKDQGYVMIKYTGSCAKVKVQVVGSGEGETYTYLLKLDGSWQAFPFSCGSGTYTVRVLENISGDSYAISLTQDVEVVLEDEFLPFLYPNQYVNFSRGSKAISKGEELAKGADTDLDVVSSVYHYVITNVVYDTAKAENVTYGYTPDVDETFISGSGICFDYAALMTAMLRSQRIPTRLDVGYSGEAYHAWISTYIADVGWIDNVIEFDGTTWKLMDPTLSASNDPSSVSKYIGDGSNYTLKYSY